MRRFAVLAAAVLTLAGVALPAGATIPVVRTVVDIVRPVDTTGHVRTGWTVALGSGTVDCSMASASVTSYSNNVDTCSPDSAYPVACWRAATVAPKVLCLSDARTHHLTKFARTGAFKATTAVSSTRRAPIEFVLDTGAICHLRSGGSVVPLRGHLTWQLTYFCGALNVWTPTPATHRGVNETTVVWKVEVGPANGLGGVTSRAIAKAYLAATA